MESVRTHIFQLVVNSKVVPAVCLVHKNGQPFSDIEIVNLLISIINTIDREQYTLSGVIKEMEEYILTRYGEIYDSNAIDTHKMP